jgi:hypothetical protein
MSHTHVSEVIHAFNLDENAENGLANMRGNSLIMNFAMTHTYSRPPADVFVH